MDIQTIDSYLPVYEFQKTQEKDFKYQMVPMIKRDVDDADYLTKISQGRDDVVTASDWAVVAKVFEFWTRRWPYEWKEFAESVKDIKDTRARKDGYSRDQGRSGVRYLAALPPRFERLLKATFPNLTWTRDFVDKLIRNIQIVQVGEKVDNWFTIPSGLPDRRVTTEEIVEKAVKSIVKKGKIKNGNTK